MRERHKEKTRLEAICPIGTEGEKGGRRKTPENMRKLKDFADVLDAQILKP